MPMVNFMASFGCIVGVLYVLFCVYLYFMQARLVYYPNLPSRKVTVDPSRVGLEFEPVTITTSDDVRIDGWFIPAEDAKGVLLFFHGNAGNISHRLDSLAIFHRLGLATLIIDYRGYGRSEGRISEKGTYLDAEAAWQYLTEKRGVQPEKILIFGRSLGGSIGAHLAARYTPGGLILESSFTSVPDMAASLYPFLPVRLLSRFSYNTREYVQSCRCPVLIIHSPEDEIIPFPNGEELFAHAQEPKMFLPIQGGHNDGFLDSGRTYLNGLERFIFDILKNTE